MSKFKRAQYSRIIKKGKFNTDRIELCNSQLDRTVLYDYNEELGDYDYLSLSWEVEKKLFSIDTIEIVILPKYHQRPTLIAFDYFGDEDYWWILALINSLESPEEFLVDNKIKLPDRNKILDLLAELSYNRSVGK